MGKIKSFFTRHPVISVIGLIFTWLLLIMMFSGIASGLLNKEFGDSTTSFIGHFVGIIFIFMMLRSLGWLSEA